MDLVGASGELAKCSHRIANVRSTGDVGVEKLAKQCAIAIAMGGRKCGVFGSVLKGANIGVDGSDGIGGQGCD